MERLKILHLEDVEDDSSVVGVLLRQEMGPCELVRVDTLEAFERELQDPAYGLVLMDYTLPGIDVQSLLAQVRITRPELPVILVTGTLGEERAVECLKKGAVDFVLKSNLKRLPMAVQRALEEAEERRARVAADENLAETLHNLSDMKRALDESALVKIMDAPLRVITYVNDAYPELTGFTKEELLGTSLELGARDLHPPGFFHNLWDTIAQGRTWKGEIRNQKKNGDFIWLDTTILPLLDSQGNVAQYLSIGFNITDRKLAEDEILRLNVASEKRVTERTLELEAAYRELETFSYSISHDLRAPLRHQNAFLEMLARHLGSELDEEAAHYLAVVQSASLRMSRLIDDLLHFSRLGRQDLVTQLMDLDSLVKDVVRESNANIGERHIIWKIGALPKIQGDSVLMRTVFENLLGNAVKFTRNQPEAVIEVGSLDPSPREWRIFIRDNGVGFDMHYADKLFAVFQRLHREEEFEGTGVGLANVQRILHRHGGQIWAEGVPGQGATFTFSLPKD